MKQCFLFHPNFVGTFKSYGLNRSLQPTKGSIDFYIQVRRNSCYDEAGLNSCYDEAGLNSCYNEASHSSYYDEVGRIGILLRILSPGYPPNCHGQLILLFLSHSVCVKIRAYSRFWWIAPACAMITISWSWSLSLSYSGAWKYHYSVVPWNFIPISVKINWPIL